MFICTKNEHKDIINIAYVHGKYNQINGNLDELVKLFECSFNRDKYRKLG